MQKIFNITGNSIYAEKLYKFIIDYKNIILISFFVGVFVNAIDIFTIKYGIDSEAYAHREYREYIMIQRYGSYILYFLIPFARYHIISQLTGIISLVMAALLTVSKHNIPKEAKLLFVLLFVTYPNFTFLQYFYFQSAYNLIGLLFVVIAYRLIECNRNIFIYILAVIFLYIGVSSYQPNFAVFLTVMMINVILDFIYKKDYKSSIKQILKGTFFLILATSLYYLSIKLIAGNLNSYHTGYIRSYNNIMNELSDIITYCYRILVSYGFNGEHTANLLVTILLILLIIQMIFIQKNLKVTIFVICLILLFLLAIFSLNTMLAWLLIRTMLAVAFYPAFIILLVYCFNSNNKLKYLTVILTILIIGYHTTYIVKYQFTYYMSYKQDEFLARDMMSRLYIKYPEIYNGKYKLAFAGELNRSADHPLTPYIKDNGTYHPLMTKKDFFGYSFFSGGYTERILAFMQLQGFPMSVQPVLNIGQDKNIKPKLDVLPAYPDNNCMILLNDTVIIKLSN